MELERIAMLADIVQAIAVVATLLFIALQIRHNTRIAMLTAAQTSAQLLANNLGRVTDNPELAELLSGARGSLVDLSDAERLRVSNFVTAAFRHIEVLHAHRRHGIYEEELWQGTAGRLRRMLSNPRIQEWWEDNRDIYASSFRNHVAADIQMIRTKAASELNS